MKVVFIGSFGVEQLREALKIVETQQTTDRVQDSCVVEVDDMSFKIIVGIMGVEKIIIRLNATL